MSDTDDVVARMQASLKKMEGPHGPVDSIPIERVSARRMALCMDNFDPIHYEEAAAKARGYRGIVAPWPLLWLAFFNCREGPPEFDFGRALLHGGDSYEFHEPMIVGDTITVTTSIVETAVKQGKAGPMGIIVMRREFHNQLGQLCAVLLTTNIRR